ncbi:hypothetical protein DV738_g2701, partial [Chaetothyriales sp. CBS 135597]
MAATGNSLLTTFQRHIEDMRGLTLCKICLRPFYEPFTLACGHTYCYSCLRDWLNGPRELRAEKGCPDCRQKIETEPSPNYTLRDLVHMFVNRVELLPEDESVEEHERGKHAEAKVLADDRKGSGVFRGMFKRTRLPLFGFDRAFRDAADGVDRCPKCMWEMEEGECNSCGWPRIDYSDDDFDSADELEELNSLGAVETGPDGSIRPRNYRYSDVGTDQSADDYSGDEDEHDSELEDFIDDEDEGDYRTEIDHDDYPTEVDQDDYQTETEHDDGLSEHTDTYDSYQSTNRDPIHTGFSRDTDSDDDQGLYQRPVSARDRSARIIDTDVSQEDDESQSERGTEGTNYDNDTDATPRRMAVLPFAGPCQRPIDLADYKPAEHTTACTDSSHHLPAAPHHQRADEVHCQQDLGGEDETPWELWDPCGGDQRMAQVRELTGLTVILGFAEEALFLPFPRVGVDVQRKRQGR